MRLPKLPSGKIDVEQTAQMVDRFMEAGGTYFDTAFVYDNVESEEVTRKALVERHPRESYTLCTKLCAWQQCRDEESAKQQFYTSLERTGAGYFDFYLLHALQRSNYKKYDEYHIWDFAKELKAKGLIRHYGFSFHADPALLEELLNGHPDVDFIQLQINYADWNNPGVASAECYRIAREHGVSTTVMEPVKGGALANPPEGVQKLFKSADPNASMASQENHLQNACKRGAYRACGGRSIAACKLCGNNYHGESHARSGKAAVYDGGACGVRAGCGAVHT